MDISYVKWMRQLELEKALFRYNLALEHRDFDTIDAILRQAETDPMLEAMIFDFNLAFATEEDDDEREEQTIYVRSDAMLSAALEHARSYHAKTEEPGWVMYLPGGGDAPPPPPPITPGARDDLDVLAATDAEPPPRPTTENAPEPALASPSSAFTPRAPVPSESSAVVTRALMRATALIAQGGKSLASYADAARLLEPVLRCPMSRRQRLRVYALRAMCFSACGPFALALACTENALTLAIELDDMRTFADMLYLRAALSTSRLKFRDAVEDYDDCIELLRDQHDPPPLNTDLEADILARRAELEFYLMRFDDAEHSLYDACQRLTFLDDIRLSNASIELARSLMSRLRGKPDEALRHGLVSLELFDSAASPATVSRAETQIAETALDLAMSFPSGTDRAAFFTLAQAHRERASTLALEAHDAGGMELAMLTRVRLSRLTNHNEARMPTLERLRGAADPRNAAHTGGNVAMFAQVITAQGDELAAQGCVEPALNCYRHVLDVLEGSDLPALALPARRALYHAQEQQPYP